VGAEEDQLAQPPEVVTVLGLQLLISEERPPMVIIIAALLGMVAIALTAIGLEALAALLTLTPRRNLLQRLRESSRPILSTGRVRVTALVPAHNEESSLPITLQALGRQTRPPDRVIVIADNCTDNTVAVAVSMGHEALETVDNQHKKGGALNQALSRILPGSTARDVILVMDADTSLSADFIATATQQLELDPELSAVGGVFFGEPGHGLVGQFQRNEYARYSRQIQARRGRVFVLTGTATMFRATALVDVAAARGIFIPGEPGQVYDTAALTEDNELTLALKSLGGTMMSPQQCAVITEVMPTWRNLWIQRKRWQRGALENLGAYGVTWATIRYWGQQLGIGYGTIALNAAIALMVITALALDQWIWFPFWSTVGLVFLIERVLTVWRAGWRGRLLAAALIPELLYDVYLQIVFLTCLFDIALNRQARWGHVQHASVQAPS
ncbi:MAG: glycosyltransferase family 2 protein, partial [Actinomycetales bacterium]